MPLMVTKVETTKLINNVKNLVKKYLNGVEKIGHFLTEPKFKPFWKVK